ncbi:ABC transporter permease [Clostridiisalibacter paucivorans]|uniref:ABC transporter permease n=1 Tax=Clostridiisalibacter paucivorans TaxID=408753 RepID=UPI00047B45B1|nr:ABC transporter permease [Clostridiisalibacter paucivorans]
MNILTILKLSVKEIMSNKLRSFLTMLGVIIGVFSILVLVSIGQGASHSITADLEKNSDMIEVNIFPMDQNDLMDYKEAMEFFDQFNAKTVSPILDNNKEIKYKDIKQSVSVKGVDKSYLEIDGSPIMDGRFIADLDIEYRQKIVVVNEMFRDTFFQGEDPIGKNIKIDGDNYKIVGILKDKEASMFEMIQEEVLMPITTMQRVLDVKGINNVRIKAHSKEEVMSLSQDIGTALDELYPSDEESRRRNYYIFTPEEIIKNINETTRIFTLMLGGIAGISLLVGGIGIMNIMFVSVTERTREIGIRKSIGAQRKDILMQFLIESSVVSGIGGIIGITFGLVVNSLIGKFSQLQPQSSPQIILLAFGFSLFVGIVFGIYPANKAAKLKPIDALRFE